MTGDRENIVSHQSSRVGVGQGCQTDADMLSSQRVFPWRTKTKAGWELYQLLPSGNPAVAEVAPHRSAKNEAFKITTDKDTGSEVSRTTFHLSQRSTGEMGVLLSDVSDFEPWPILWPPGDIFGGKGGILPSSWRSTPGICSFQCPKVFILSLSAGARILVQGEGFWNRTTACPSTSLNNACHFVSISKLHILSLVETFFFLTTRGSKLGWEKVKEKKKKKKEHPLPSSLLVSLGLSFIRCPDEGTILAWAFSGCYEE